tara:strand:- start:1457 stop:2005 length:549 start_codon:yes stop_codon:yes gene_type:complete
MAHRPVGTSIVLSTSATSGMTTSFVVSSNVIRVVAVSNGAHVKIDSAPTATTADYYVPAGTSATLALTKASNRVVGITTGATTTITFAEGTQCPFGVGDFITITGGSNSSLNLRHVEVTSVDTTSDVNGNFQAACTVAYDSGSAGDFAGADVTASLSVRVAARTDSGSGTLHAQLVQTTGEA